MNTLKGYNANVYVSESLFNKSVLANVDDDDSGYTEEIHSV